MLLSVVCLSTDERFDVWLGGRRVGLLCMLFSPSVGWCLFLYVLLLCMWVSLKCVLVVSLRLVVVFVRLVRGGWAGGGVRGRVVLIMAVRGGVTGSFY